MVPVLKVIASRTRGKVEVEPGWSIGTPLCVVGEMKGTYYAILGQVIGKPDNDTQEEH